jgi:hypothetical protein
LVLLSVPALNPYWPYGTKLGRLITLYFPPKNGHGLRRCLLRPSFVIPKGNTNPWRKVWEKLIKQGRLVRNEHRNISYYCRPSSPIWRWRRLLVFATQVKRKSFRTRTFFILNQWETAIENRTVASLSRTFCHFRAYSEPAAKLNEC